VKKYKLEISLGVIFSGVIIALLWKTLQGFFSPLPLILLGLVGVVLALVLVPWPSQVSQADSTNERYAPKYFGQIILSSIVGIALILGVAALLNRPRFSKTIDLTERKTNSLTDETKSVLANLSKPVRLYCIPSPEGGDDYCSENAHLRRLYSEQTDKLVQETVSLVDLATLQKINPSGFGRLVLMTEDNRSEVEGKVSESKLTNSILNLVKHKKTVYLLAGSGEPSVNFGGKKSYDALLEMVRARSYDIKEHSIMDGDIPADGQVLVAGDTPSPYSPIAENIIRKFLARGGNLIFMSNPYRDSGLQKLWTDLGVKMENQLLVNNENGRIGAQLARWPLMRTPVALGNFSQESPISSVFARILAFSDGARPITILENKQPEGNGGLKLKHTVLVNAVDVKPSTLTDEERNKINLDAPLSVKVDDAFDPKKLYPVGVQIEIDGVEKLAEGLPAATIAMKGEGSPGTDPAKPENAVGTEANKDASKPAEAKKDEKKVEKAEVVLLGFGLAGALADRSEANKHMLSVSISHLYKDKELVNIPSKDFAPKSFRTERNPAAFLGLFAWILPLITLLTGAYMFMRRRSA
jgi:hypothetical protein